MDDQIKWVTDTKVEHIELDDIITQMDRPRWEPRYRRIKRSGLVEATVFPQFVQAPKFIMMIAQFYNADTRRYIDDQGRIVIDLSTDVLGFVFVIPSSDEALLTIEEEAVEIWENDTASYKRHVNQNWLKEER